MKSPDASSPSVAMMAFLVLAFAVVGLAGLLAAYAAPIPLERALARETALDRAQAAAHGPDPQAALDALRPELDESADAILPFGPDFDAKLAHERIALRQRYLADEAATLRRMRLLVGVVTVMGAAFGVAVLRFSSREIR